MKPLLLLWICCASVHGASFRTLISFSGEDPADWRSGANHSRPAREGEGVVLPLRFPGSDRQVLFERPLRADLGKATGIRFRLASEAPERILEGKIRFQSGNGGYTAGFTLPHSGRNHVRIPRSAFTPDGAPAGWSRIEGVRFTFWPRGGEATVLRPHSLESVRAEIQLIAGESLSRTGDERYLSRVTLWHMQRLLDGLGLPYGITSAEGLADMPEARVIVMPYAPNLGDAEVERLRARVRGGARLIVFENEHAGLAELLGVELGVPRRSQSVGMYDQLRFSGGRFPARVYQHAWGFRSVRPRAGGEVIARWGGARGAASELPAALLHERGAWFVSSWRSGDLPGKRETLLALLESWTPNSLVASAQYYLDVRPPPRVARGAAPRRMLDQARQLRATAREDLRGGAPARAVRRLREADALVERAAASDARPWRPRMVGIWDQQGTGFHAGGWDETCRALKAAGFTAVFPNLGSAGRAHYESELLPGSKTLERYGDQLQQFTRAAHRHGLEAHVWKINWRLTQPDPDMLATLGGQGRLMQDRQGNDLPWLSFSHPDNVQFEIDTLLEILRLAPVDGIHLDYMRYPGAEADYGPAARRAFEAELGRRVGDWPGGVTDGPLAERFQDFRRQQLHNAMERIHRAVKAEFPDTVLSAAVWGAWPDCAEARGQDWPVWARNGWVDLLMPMNYTDNPHQFAGWLDVQRVQPGVAERLVPGIGIISTNAELAPGQILEQIDLSRQRGTRGVMFYRLDTSLPERLFPFLRTSFLRESTRQ